VRRPSNHCSSLVLFEYDVAGTLTLLNTSASFKPKGRFLFGSCGDGLPMYTYNSASSMIGEVAASPFTASTGNSGTLIVTESTGQYVYLLKINPASGLASKPLFSTLSKLMPALRPWFRSQHKRCR
jgi:hypothetical protein